MGFGRYIKCNAASCTIAALGLAILGLVLHAVGLTRDLVFLAIGIVALALIFAFVLAYLRHRKFWNDLGALTRATERPLWALEMVDRPEDAADALAYDALKTVTQTANEEVAEARRQVTDYRDYIETWVHEAKSPLAAAHLALENIGATDDTSDIAAHTGALEDELDRLERYIDQALFFARSETLEQDYLIRAHSLHKLIRASIKENARLLISAHVTPELGNLDFTVFTDEKWLRFIVGQTIQNSIKYKREDVPARIRFSAQLLDSGTANERIELAIADNGIGVCKADLSRVFNRGFTGENGRIDGKKSTGIGLYLVKRLCQKMDVGCRAESCEGAGFSLFLTFSTNKFHYFE